MDSKEKLVLVDKYIRHNQYSNAIELLVTITKTDPLYYESQLDLGFIYDSQNLFDKALECFLKIPKSNKLYVEAIHSCGVVYGKKKQPDLAIQYFKKVDKESSVYYLSQKHLGVAYREVNKLSQAITAFKKIPVNTDFYIDAQYLLGETYFDLNQLEEARAYFKKISSGHTLYSNAQYSIALTYHSERKFKETILVLQLIRKNTELYYEAQFLIGRIYADFKEFELAKNIFSTIPPSEEKYPDALCILGKIENEQKNYIQAATMFRRIEPVHIESFLEAQYYLAQIYIKFGEIDLAEQAANTIKENVDDYGNIQFQLALFYAMHGESDVAIQYWQKVNPENINYKKALFNIAYAYHQRANYDKAIECYKNIPKADDQYCFGLLNRYSIYKKNNNLDEAKECLKEYAKVLLTRGINDFSAIMRLYDKKNENIFTGNQLKKYISKIFKDEQKNNQETFDAFCIFDDSQNEKPLLYQYMRCSKESLMRIKNNRLAFTNPKYFNDPYDPLIKILTDIKDEVLNLFNFRIACLSRTYKNILMWSHYADRHTGICIAYDISTLIKEENMLLKKVSFRENISKPDSLSSFSLNDGNKTNIFEAFSTKHSDWKYEQEYRLITQGAEVDKIYKEVPIVKIFLGKDISSENEELIKHIVEHKEEKITVTKMCFGDDNVFELREEL